MLMRKKKNQFNKTKIYTGIAKVGDEEKGIIFVKYRFNSIEKFIEFMNKRYTVFYMNIYANLGLMKGKQVFYYTVRNGIQNR